MVLGLVRLTASQLHCPVVQLNFEDKPLRAGLTPPAHWNKFDSIRTGTGRRANERHLDFEGNVSIAAKKVLLVLRAGIKTVADAQDLHHDAAGALLEIVYRRLKRTGVAVVVIQRPE